MSKNKSFSTETSERYARALFEVANEEGQLDNIENEVRNLQLLFDNSEQLTNFIQNPTKGISTQKNLINLLSQKLDISKNLKNFLFLLIEKRRIFFVKKIFLNFLKFCLSKRGETKASLISSKKLSNEELEILSRELSSSTGSTVKFDFKVDETLIGGLKLQLGSFMIDTSIKSKLKKLEKSMIEV